MEQIVEAERLACEGQDLGSLLPLALSLQVNIFLALVTPSGLPTLPFLD